MKLQLDDGFGFAEVEITGPNGQPGPSARLDLWEAFNTYSAMRFRHTTDDRLDAVALAGEWVDWLAGKGLSGLSHGAAFRVFNHVQAMVAELKKSETPPASPSADSAGSTGSPSSA